MHDAEAVLLAQQTGRVPGETEALERRGVEPAAVQIPRDEHDGDVGNGRVENGSGRGIRPQSVTEALAHEHEPRCRSFGCRGEGSGLDGGCRGREVEPPPAERPLTEVHVLIPQARNHGAPREIHAVAVEGADLDDRPVLDPQVDDLRVDPRVTEQHARRERDASRAPEGGSSSARPPAVRR